MYKRKAEIPKVDLNLTMSCREVHRVGDEYEWGVRTRVVGMDDDGDFVPEGRGTLESARWWLNNPGVRRPKKRMRTVRGSS